MRGNEIAWPTISVTDSALQSLPRHHPPGRTGLVASLSNAKRYTYDSSRKTMKCLWYLYLGMPSQITGLQTRTFSMYTHSIYHYQWHSSGAHLTVRGCGQTRQLRLVQNESYWKTNPITDPKLSPKPPHRRARTNPST